MGYRTQNIDRLAREGMMFTDAYGEQSCTAGRSALLRLQLDPFRSNSGGVRPLPPGADPRLGSFALQP